MIAQRRFAEWTQRRHPPQWRTVQLERRRIYILPTGFGYVFALMLGVLFLWAINYNNSLGFALIFLLTAVGLDAMRRSHDTLLRLRIHPGKAEPVFVGQDAQFSYQLENPDQQDRYGIALQAPSGQPCYVNVPAQDRAAVVLAIPATRRGRLRPGRLKVLTRFPLGLFQAWSWVEFEQTCLVYPRPQGKRPLPLEAKRTQGGSVGESGSGSEDYAGLRAYRPGDSPRHIAWKSAARSAELPVKRFVDQTRLELWLDWEWLDPEIPETRLAQLCQWVLKAEAEQQDYGLRLPDRVLPPAHGEGQRRQCLEALALYGLDKE